MNTNIKKMVNLIMRAVGLAMGVAVIVTSIVSPVAAETAVTMLGIGLACLGIASFDNSAKEE